MPFPGAGHQEGRDPDPLSVFRVPLVASQVRALFLSNA